MTDLGGLIFDGAIPEADAVAQHTSVRSDDDDTWRDAAHITAAREREATEADLIDQAIEVPLPDDDLAFYH